MERGKAIAHEGIFTGGKLENFEMAGRKLLMMLLSQRLTPSSRVLDIGCGALRCGYWLIYFLDQGNYFGIEPNTKMLDAGMRILLEPGLKEQKKPKFDHNSDFDLAVFKVKFDFIVAFSIWTHTSKPQIQAMLNGFVKTTNQEGVFLGTYHPTTWYKRDYQGATWIGTSRDSTTRGMVNHRLGWIQKECTERGLVAEELKDKALKYWNQTWIRVRHR
jgi:cyclopropane fatty-acyl-phospholipid synthase-like methyltransferase